MITKTYNMKLQEELHTSRVLTSNSNNNAIALNVLSDSNVFVETYNKDTLSIKESRISSKAIKTNTTDVIATDIIIDNVVYYFKHKKLSYPSYTIKYSSATYEPSGQFIYSTEKYVTANIVDANNVTVEQLELEFVPVFIDKRMLNLKSYIDIDGKYFTPKRKGDKILISFSSDISSYTIDNAIFKCINTNNDKLAKFILKEFLYVQNKNLNNLNSIIEYDYFEPTFTLIRSANDFFNIDKTGYCYLSNTNIDISNVNIISINQLPITISLEKYVNYSSGKINLSELLRSNIIDDGDLIEVEYNYLHINNQYIEVDIRKLNKDSKIHTYVSATKIKTPSSETNNDRSFGAFISQNNFVVNHVFNFTSIDISQSGSEYIFDYSIQNEMTLTPSGSIESFYTENTGSIDSYLNSRHYKESGTFSIGEFNNEIYAINKFPKQKDNFYEPEKIYKSRSSVVVVGYGNPEIPAGIKVIEYRNIFPFEYFIDHKTTSNIFVKLNIEKELTFINGLIDPDIVDFCNASDEINKDYTFDAENFKIVYIDNDGEVEVTPEVFIDNDTKDIYLKAPNTTNKEIRLKYSDMISNYGFLIWKILYKTQIT